ncbi:MAG: hypothetical protein U1F57_08685 [bacterium]
MDTPVSILLKMGRQENSFLFESMEGRALGPVQLFRGFAPFFILESYSDCWEIRRRGWPDLETGTGESFVVLRRKCPASAWCPTRRFLVCAAGGGIFGLRLRAVFEASRLEAGRPPFPDSYFGLYDRLVIFDNLRHSAFVVVNAYLDGKESLKFTTALGSS